MCVVKPSTTISILIRAPPVRFSKALGLRPSEVRSCWIIVLSSRDGVVYQALHPCLRGRTIDQLSTMVPITLHEDAGPYSQKRSTNIVSFSSLLGKGSKKEVKYLIMSAIKLKKSAGTQDAAAWAVVLDDCTALATLL